MASIANGEVKVEECVFRVFFKENDVNIYLATHDVSGKWSRPFFPAQNKITMTDIVCKNNKYKNLGPIDRYLKDPRTYDFGEVEF